MEDDQTHSVQDATLHAIYGVVGDVFVRLVPPPKQHVRLHKHVFRESVFGFVERSGADGHVPLGAESRRDGAVYSFRIDQPISLIFALVAILVPNRDSNLGHEEAPYPGYSGGESCADSTSTSRPNSADL